MNIILQERKGHELSKHGLMVSGRQHLEQVQYFMSLLECGTAFSNKLPSGQWASRISEPLAPSLEQILPEITAMRAKTRNPTPTSTLRIFPANGRVGEPGFVSTQSFLKQNLQVIHHNTPPLGLEPCYTWLPLIRYTTVERPRNWSDLSLTACKKQTSLHCNCIVTRGGFLCPQ